MLIVVRHGQSVANLTHSFAGHWDIDLTELGKKQAQLSADYVYKNHKIDGIYASDLKRAFNTAKVLSAKLGLTITPIKELREISAGEWEEQLFSDIATKHREDFYVWMNDLDNSRATGGESVAELKERVVNEITKLAKENIGKTVYVATHATPIRAICAHINGKKMQEIDWVSNASLTYIDYIDGKLQILKSGFDKHLQNLKTELPKRL
ncbi:MAG: histidine phosphatase family protein [Clostridia bacterium]|nr:histidine phosphatase family protein [Clostridia bacterium]